MSTNPPQTRTLILGGLLATLACVALVAVPALAQGPTGAATVAPAADPTWQYLSSLGGPAGMLITLLYAADKTGILKRLMGHASDDHVRRLEAERDTALLQAEHYKGQLAERAAADRIIEASTISTELMKSLVNALTREPDA